MTDFVIALAAVGMLAILLAIALSVVVLCALALAARIDREEDL